MMFWRLRFAFFFLSAILAAALLAKAISPARSQIIMQPPYLYAPLGYQQITAPLGGQQTVAFSIAAPTVVTLANANYQANTPIVFGNGTGSLPTGIVAGTVYYVTSFNLAAGSFTISAAPGCTSSACALPATGATTAGTVGIPQAGSVLTGLPVGARLVVLCSEAQNIRWRDDGVAPTATVGMLLVTGGTYACMSYSGNPLSAFQFAAAATGAIVDVSYYK